MAIYLISNRGTAGERQVTDLAARLKKEHGVEAELVDADSPKGIGIVEHYDIMGRPAVMVARLDGSPLQLWQGADALPSPGEVSYYANM